MTDKELLVSISQIMDNKIKPLEKRLDEFDEKLDRKIDNIEQKLSVEFSRLDNKINNVEKKLSAEISRLDSDIQRINSNITLLNRQIDNSVVPRLNEIENCYLSTSERYMQETDKFVSFGTDLAVIKDVVIEHGNRLKAIGA